MPTPTKEQALNDLLKYVSDDWRTGPPTDGLLERMITAVEAGATPTDLKMTLKSYLPDHSMYDKSYG